MLRLRLRRQICICSSWFWFTCQTYSKGSYEYSWVGISWSSFSIHIGIHSKYIEFKLCIIWIVISANYIDELVVDTIPLDVCGIVFGSPYLYTRNAIFKTREKQFSLVKDGKSFVINARKGKSKISLIIANKEKKMISSSRKFILLLLNI